MTPVNQSHSIIKIICSIFHIFIFIFSLNVAAKEYFVSKLGDDGNKGSERQPFQTINHAAQVAVPGDVITVREGTYREWVNPKRGGKKNKPIVYQTAAGEEVVILGSEAARDWKRVDDLWLWKAKEAFFGEVNPFTTLSRHPEYVEEDETSKGWGWLIYGRWTHRGDVFLNGEGLTEKENYQDLSKPFTWYTNTEDGVTHIWANFGRFNPNDEQVEINVRGQAFSPSKPGLSYIEVRGFTIKNIANHWAPPTEYQPGAIAPNGGTHWVIEDNIIEYARGVAISLGNPTHSYKAKKKGHHIVRNNIIWRPGQAGIAGEKWTPYSQITNNIVEDVNYREEFGGWETAGIKFHNSKHVLIENNLIRGVFRDIPEEGAAHGIWVDFRNRHFRLTRNVITEVEGESILMEAIWKGPNLIDNNVIYEGSNAIFSTRDDAWVHNFFYKVKTRWKDQDYGGRPKNKNARWYNNVFVGSGLNEMPQTKEYSVDHNVYFGGALKSEWESKSIVSEYEPTVTLATVDKTLTLELSWPEALSTESNFTVSTKSLDLPIKNNKGKKLKFIRDFSGNRSKQGYFGPFSNLSGQSNRIPVFEYSDKYLKHLEKRKSLPLN